MTIAKYFILIVVFCTNFIYASQTVYLNKDKLDIYKLANVTSKAMDKIILLPNDISSKVQLSTSTYIEKSKLINILNASLLQEGYQLIIKDDIYIAQKILESQDENNMQVELIKDLEDKILDLESKIKKKKAVKKQIQIQEKLFTDIISLQNAKASNIQKALTPILNKKKQKQKLYISSDDESNAIILMGSKEYVSELKSLILKLDDYRAQVYVKAKIIEISETRTNDVGLKYGLSAIKSNQSGLMTLTSLLTTTAVPVDTSGIGLNIPSIDKGLALGASINLLNLNGALDIVSEPSILCINNKESSIYIGQTKSFQTSSRLNITGSTQDQSFVREDIGLKLKIRPRISNEDKVLLEIDTLLEDVRNSITNGQPDTSKKEIKTTAIVNSGESVIIGGLIKTTIDTTEDNVAGLSQIPLLGELFKHEENIKDKINLVIVVTPYVIPKSKNLTYVQHELSKLKILEDKYTNNIQIQLDKGVSKIKKN